MKLCCNCFVPHFVAAIAFIFPAIAPSSAASGDLRVGIIGLDTSHVVAFTKLLNDETSKDHIAGARVVAGYKGGSPDIEASASRVDGYTLELVTKYGVKLYDEIEELARNVDAIMIESIDGRPHLEQARRVFPFGKPVFIDKPLAGSLRDGIEIFRLARQHNVPVFSSSSLRYHAATEEIKRSDIGKLLGAFTMSPASIEPHHPDLFWYGIHATEALYALMGRGCEHVTRTHTPDADIVTGVWSNERVGTVRGARNAKSEYLILAFGSKGMLQTRPGAAYAALLKEVVKFFRTGVAPVEPAETLEILAFMEAADESKRRGGIPVSIFEVMKTSGGSGGVFR